MPARGANGRGLGTAEGTIRLNYDDAGARAAEKSLAGIGKTAQDSGRQVKAAGATMAAAGAVIAGGFVLAVKSAANFEAALSAVQAVSGATTAEMDAVRAKALQLGKDTVFSSSEAANAMEELVKAGVAIPDVLNGASDAALALAAATGIDMPRAAGLSANAMNEFKLAATDLPGVVNRLAGAANASAIDITELGDALSYVGPVAHALGLSINDTATAIAILGNNGIKGSSAGTALRAILSNLTPITKRATTEFERLGLITADGTNLFLDANGALLPLDRIIQVLNDHTKNLNATAKNTFAKKAFGLESLAAASVLMGETAGSVDAMNDAIRKTTAADVAATRMKNLKGSIEQLKGSLETAVNTAIGPFLGAIGQVVDGIKTMVDVFLKLPAPIRNLITLAGGLSGAFLLIAGSALLVIPKLVEMKKAFDALAATATFQKIAANIGLLTAMIGGPWVAALAAAALAVGALLLMNKKSRPPIDDLTEAFKRSTSALDKDNRSIIANRLLRDDALDAARRLGINLGDLTSATLGVKDAEDRVNATLADGRATAKEHLRSLIERRAASKDYAEQQRLTYDIAHAGDTQLARDLATVGGAYANQSDDVLRGKAAAAEFNAEVEATDALAKSAATTIADNLNEAITGNRTSSDAAAGANQHLATEVKGAGDAADTADREISQLNSTIEKLFDDAYGADEAVDAFHSKLNALKAAAKESGTALRGNSDDAIAHRNAFRDLGKEVGTIAEKLNQENKPPAEVLAGIQAARGQLESTAHDAGFARSEVAKLIAPLNELEGTYEITVKANTAAAKADVVDLQSSIDKLHGKSVLIGTSERTGENVTIPKAASGAIVTRATHILAGEAGPEAIAPLPDLADAFLRILGAGRVNLVGAMDGSGSARSRGGGTPQGSGSSRLVRGELDISPRGKAYIRGVAEDVTDANDQFTRAHARMG